MGEVFSGSAPPGSVPQRGHAGFPAAVRRFFHGFYYGPHSGFVKKNRGAFFKAPRSCDSFYAPGTAHSFWMSRVKNSTVLATVGSSTRSSSLWIRPRCSPESAMAENLYTFRQISEKWRESEQAIIR